MDGTFALSNISPQVGNGFNRDYWCRLEMLLRGQQPNHAYPGVAAHRKQSHCAVPGSLRPKMPDPLLD